MMYTITYDRALKCAKDVYMSCARFYAQRAHQMSLILQCMTNKMRAFKTTPNPMQPSMNCSFVQINADQSIYNCPDKIASVAAAMLAQVHIHRAGV